MCNQIAPKPQGSTDNKEKKKKKKKLFTYIKPTLTQTLDDREQPDYLALACRCRRFSNPGRTRNRRFIENCNSIDSCDEMAPAHRTQHSRWPQCGRTE